MWAIGVYDFGVTDEQFWNLTPAQFDALSRRHDHATRQHDLRFGLVCSMIGNSSGGKKGGGHFSPYDFVPKYGDEEEDLTPSDDMSPDEILAYLKAAFPPKEERGG